MAKMLPGQVRVRGYHNPRTGKVEFKLARAPDVPEETAQWLYQQLTSPRETLLTILNRENPPEPPFLPAWEERGFNLASVRFSIFTLAAQRKQPKRIQVPRQKPGVLYAKWGREPHDSPDLICTWHWPCTRRDSRFFHHYLTTPIQGTGFHDHKGLWEALADHGFDNKTFKFEIAHAAPLVC